MILSSSYNEPKNGYCFTICEEKDGSSEIISSECIHTFSYSKFRKITREIIRMKGKTIEGFWGMMDLVYTLDKASKYYICYALSPEFYNEFRTWNLTNGMT
jgi:hypothetical protein